MYTFQTPDIVYMDSGPKNKMPVNRRGSTIAWIIPGNRTPICSKSEMFCRDSSERHNQRKMGDKKIMMIALMNLFLIVDG